ncbi:MAG: HAD-IA family hydrolase [Gammaproteobacteria bacterium]|nr:HAD-IA family hydrolase [Gammaproteobacteria bacterium]
MKLPYKLVVFDWEGTLGDPLGHVHQALATEATKLGIDYDVSYARQYVSLGLDKAVRKIFPDLSLHQYERLLLGVQQDLVLNHAVVYLFDGAKQLIEKLHATGISLAIATNKGQQSLERALEACGLNPFFAVTRSAGQLPAKPCPDMLEAILDVVGCTPEETLMIGDSVSDMEMAEAMNVPSIGVDFYHQQTDDLKGAGAGDVFYDFKQIEDYFGV